MPTQALPCSLCVPNLTKEHTLNAISATPHDPAERIARHLRTCQRLAELGMELVEAAAGQVRQALADIPAPEAPAPPQPATQAPTRGTRAPRLPDARAAEPRAPSWGLLFIRLANCVRQTMALEARLAADAHATRRVSPVALDPRRAPLRDAFHEAVAHHPNRTQIRRDIDACLDRELAADPDRTIPLPDLLEALADHLEIELDFSKLSDEVIGLDRSTTDPPE